MQIADGAAVAYKTQQPNALKRVIFAAALHSRRIDEALPRGVGKHGNPSLI